MEIHWEKTAGKKGEFSALGGAGIADMADAAAAAHDGDVGLEVTFDDSDVAYGSLTLDTAAQKTVAMGFWFNANDVFAGEAKVIQIAKFSSLSEMSMRTKAAYNAVYTGSANDVGNTYSSDHPIAAGWNWIVVEWKASDKPAANNGHLRVYVNNLYSATASQTGLDNDTKTADGADFGMIVTNSVGTYTGSYYLDTMGVIGKIPSDYAIAPARDLALSAQQRGASLTAHQRDTNMVVLE